MKRMISILIVGFVFNVVMLAQDKVISGIVIDSLTQEPLPFTNIGVMGKALGSISNSEGNYTLSLEDVADDDTVIFSFIGYENVKFSAAQLIANSTVKLVESAIQLSDFSVLSREYTPVEILDLAKENFTKNQSAKNVKQEVFKRHASFTTIHKAKLECKKTTFDTFDERFIEDLNKEMPENINGYSDYLIDMVYSDSASKLIPIEGQSLVEDWDFNEEFDERMKASLGTLEDDLREGDSYFKIRSGVLAGPVEFEGDTSLTHLNDSLHYSFATDKLKPSLTSLLDPNSTIDSKEWDFFHKYRAYSYTLKDITIVNNELAYVITFSSKKKKGSYQGTICIATENFALLQVDYAFAEGEKGTDISLLGVSYLLEDSKGRAIFEKGEDGYYLKYFLRESNERLGVDRNFSLKQKHDGRLINKTLQEVKLHLDLDVTMVEKDEFLVVSQQKIKQEEYDEAVEPDVMKLKKVNKYAPGIWESNSIIEPTRALKEYQQQY